MQKDIRVLIVEDDPYARDLMSLLLTRDWRTRVIGEVENERQLVDFLAPLDQKVDVVILDTEIPGKPDLPLVLAAATQRLHQPPAVLFTGTRADERILTHLAQTGVGGYVLKGETLYALASAVALVSAGTRVITPGIYQIAARLTLPDETVILDGRRLTTNFTPRENELIRLGIIFNLAIRDIADELVLGPGWISEIVSTIYRKLGLREILTGEVPLDMYFNDGTVLAHCQEIIKRARSNQSDGKLRKASWMSTLAFHLLTVPEITDS